MSTWSRLRASRASRCAVVAFSSAAEDSATVSRLMRVLSDREREVLRLRFEEDLTQRDIADRVGLSQMHVSRLLRDALGALAERLGEDELPAPRKAA